MPLSEVMHATRLVAVWRCIRDGAEEHAESIEAEVILLERVRKRSETALTRCLCDFS